MKVSNSRKHRVPVVIILLTTYKLAVINNNISALQLIKDMNIFNLYETCRIRRRLGLANTDSMKNALIFIIQ